MSVTIYLLLITVTLCEVGAFTNETIDSLPEIYQNLTINNELWSALIKDCNKPTMACIRNTMFDYLQKTLEYSRDYQMTDFLKLTQNNNDYRRLIQDSSSKDANLDDDETEEPRSDVEEISRTLYDKSVQFLMTHDMEVQLPEMIFDSAVLKVSPRSIEDNGATVKIEFQPNQIAEGRIFKKITKKIRDKLIYALLAILLVIKLLAVKFMFFMPMMVGAVTAKKLLIKVLLFLFPALHHLFKLCPYVPHGTKYHHHKHQIKHIHQIGPPKPHHHHHHHPHHSHKEGIEIIAPHDEGPPSLHGIKPSLHHFIDIEPPTEDLYNPYDSKLEYYPKGPIFKDHFLSYDRKDNVKDDNDLQAWGQGQSKKPPAFNRPLSPSEVETMVLKAEKEALLKQRLQQEKLRIQQENVRLQEELRRAIKLQDKLRQQAATIQTRLAPPPVQQFVQKPPQLNEISTERVHITTPRVQITTPRVQITTPRIQITTKPMDVNQRQPTRFEQALHQAASITYDAFYSPILDKIDKILNGLGVNDEPCRERLVCSMYKNPSKFSPHSNLLSVELSRDPNELQKPTSTNAAVIRFYRYVQAARDGQDKRDCIRLYANCAINTDK